MFFSARFRFALFVLFCIASALPAQQVFFEDTFNGGVVTGGYGLGTASSGTGTWTLNIPPGSSIRQAYLLAARIGTAPSYTVTLNGTNYTFATPTNQVSPDFMTIYGNPSAIHAIDVTSNISPATTNYTLVCPTTGTVSTKYAEFYLFIAFDNPALPMTSSVLYIQNYDVASPLTLVLPVTAPISVANPIGFATVGGFAAAGTVDCQNVSVNGNAIGYWSGRDVSAASNYGSIGAFGYWNNTLVGFGDDTPNATITGPDNLADISAYSLNGANSITILTEHCAPSTTSMDNHTWMMALTYSGSTILSAEISALQASLTEERNVQLDWQSFTETQHDYFEIQRTRDRESFESIGKVAGNGTSSAAHAYDFLDTEPFNGRSWYRLKLVDQNGKVGYSEIREVNLEAILLEGVYPNPASEQVTLEVELTEPGMVKVCLADLMGKTIQWKESALMKGKQQILMDVSEIAAGAYFLRLNVEGGPTIVHPITVQ